MQKTTLKQVSALALLATTLVATQAMAAAVENTKPRNRVAAKIKPKSAVAPLPAVEPALSEDQLAVAPRVHAGDANCEFKQKVSISADPAQPGRFRLQFGKLVYSMTPEPTSTGAVRLEDKKAGVVWLQIPSKSMLMNTKLGQRMVDSCQHAEQQAFVTEAAQAPADSGIGITPEAAVKQ